MIQMEKVENIEPIPFKLNADWGNYEEVETLVERVWNITVKVSPNFVWEFKLSNVKKELLRWLKENYQPPIKKMNEKISTP